MNLLTPNLTNANGATIVVNSLFDSRDPGVLAQDLLLVELPGKTYIDVSWFPEHDPSGAYIITVFRGHDQLVELEAKSASGAIQIVERLASGLTQGTAIVAGRTLQVRMAAGGAVAPPEAPGAVLCSTVYPTGPIDSPSAV
jgi:hypothetical protein